jgi:hypothetical protein
MDHLDLKPDPTKGHVEEETPLEISIGVALDKTKDKEDCSKASGKETCSQLDNASLPEMTMPWTHLPPLERQPLTKKRKSIARQGDALNVESKGTSTCLPVKEESTSFEQSHS